MATTQTLNSNSNPSNKGLEGFLHLKNPGDNWGREIGDFLTLGRDISNSIQIDDPWASSRHARIENSAMGYRLRDLRSKNGTFLNGARIMEALLCEGDRIQIGQTQLEFSYTRDFSDLEETLASKNSKWAEVLSRLPNVAESDLPILILGPSGTGKDVIARNLHKMSARRLSPFVSVNCSALSESLIESELFGHTRGSFTGATNDRKGAFESARGGTLFLDEIGDLPLSLQPKLLRALENQEIRPVGSDKNIKTDVRILAATHSNLKEKVRIGEFRLDLYFRLNVIQLRSLALKERMEDFEDLLMVFAKKERVFFSPEAITALSSYDWPGNIRELKNSVAKARALLGSRVETAADALLLIDFPSENNQLEDLPPLPTTSAVSPSFLKNLEFEMIKQRLIANNGNQRKTAQDLGIPKSTLHDRIKSYGIKIEKP